MQRWPTGPWTRAENAQTSVPDSPRRSETCRSARFRSTGAPASRQIARLASLLESAPPPQKWRKSRLVFARLNQASVCGELLTGVLIGPAALGLIGSPGAGLSASCSTTTVFHEPNRLIGACRIITIDNPGYLTLLSREHRSAATLPASLADVAGWWLAGLAPRARRAAFD